MPHSIGTDAHEEVRKYLFNQFKTLGVETQVQETTVSKLGGAGGHTKAYVYNIIGVIRGRKSSKAELLVAHYDPEPNALGAADDGAGIASLLETARAIKSGAQLQNDVIFLMTDGEECGLFGATAFMRHPLAKDVGVVINMEARGDRGPSLTFELSPENGWIVKEFIPTCSTRRNWMKRRGTIIMGRGTMTRGRVFGRAWIRRLTSTLNGLHTIMHWIIPLNTSIRMEWRRT